MKYFPNSDILSGLEQRKAKLKWASLSVWDSQNKATGWFSGLLLSLWGRSWICTSVPTITRVCSPNSGVHRQQQLGEIPGGHSSQEGRSTSCPSLAELRWPPLQLIHTKKASHFQELVFIIKVIFDVNKMPQLQKKLRTLQSQCKQSNGTPIIKILIQITPKSNWIF